MLKIACTLPNIAITCLHKSSNAKFYPFAKSDKDSLKNIRGDLVGGPSVAFARKAVVIETLIRDSSNWCTTLARIEPYYPYSMSQTMPQGLYTG